METDNAGPVRLDPSADGEDACAAMERTLFAWPLEGLELQQERVARTIADAVRHEVKEYEALAAPDQHANVVFDTQQHLRTFARCAPTWRMPEREELDFISDLASERAAAGFPLEAMLHAFRVGHRVFWDWLIAQVEDARKGEVALAITPFMHEYLGAVTRRLTETYVEAVQTFIADADKNRRDLLEALLRGEQPERTRPLAQALGLDPDVQYIVIVAAVTSPEPRRANELLRRAEDVIRRRLLEAGANAFSILREQEVVLLVPWGAGHRRVLHTALEPAAVSMGQMYGAQLLAGGSMACEGVAEISRGYQEARLALQRASATGDFVALADASLYESLLALGASSVQRRLPPWADDLAADGSPQRNDLIRTLLAYVAANMSVERSARALFVHPNTVRYRLRRLAKLTGLDVDSFYDLIELMTVVRLLPAGQVEPRPALASARFLTSRSA